MVKVLKLAGEIPARVVVGRTPVDFDHDGFADVDEGVANILAQIPDYEIVDGESDESTEVQTPEGDQKQEPETQEPEADTEPEQEPEAQEPEVEKVKAPAKKAVAPKRTVPAKKTSK